MISRLLKRSPFCGGPHFDQLSTLYFDLEGKTLELTIPASDAKWSNSPRRANFPYNTPGWFGAHSKRPNIRDWVHVYTEIWYYFPARFSRLVDLAVLGRKDPIGDLSIGVHLCKVEDGRALDVADPRSLASYIQHEYESYFESPEIGSFGKGQNTRIRRDYPRMFGGPEGRAPGEYENAIANSLEPLPKYFDIVEIGGGQWTRFQLGKPDEIPTRFYCLPLSEHFYLHIEIGARFRLQSHDVVLSDMLQLADWLVQHMKITFPGNEALLPNKQ